MAAMKPRTGDGPMEVTKEGRGIVMRVPLEGGGRLVVEMTPEEADTLSKELTNVGSLKICCGRIPGIGPEAAASTRPAARFTAASGLFALVRRPGRSSPGAPGRGAIP